MGGAEAGEVASALAVETLAERFAAGDGLAEAAQAANEAVFTRARSRAEESGMGTTLTAVLVEGETARFAHVGDSRAYRLRDGKLEPLSDDHSLVGEMVRGGTLTREEAAAHPQRSILSRALGTEAVVEVDEFTSDLQAGDVFLLCSDGLSGEVPEATIGELLAAAGPEEAARGLVAAARAAGGHDNITAVVIRIEAADAGGAESTTQVLAVPADAGDDAGAADAGATADAADDAGEPAVDTAGGDTDAEAALAPVASAAVAPAAAVRIVAPPAAPARRRARPGRHSGHRRRRRREHVLLRRRRGRPARRLQRSAVVGRARSSSTAST